MKRRIDDWRIKADGRTARGKMLGATFQAGPLDLSSDLGSHTEFDEIVVGEWMHFERMNDNEWFGRLGGRDLLIHVTQKAVTVKDNETGDLLWGSKP